MALSLCRLSHVSLFAIGLHVYYDGIFLSREFEPSYHGPLRRQTVVGADAGRPTN